MSSSGSGSGSGAAGSSLTFIFSSFSATFSGSGAGFASSLVGAGPPITNSFFAGGEERAIAGAAELFLRRGRADDELLLWARGHR